MGDLKKAREQLENAAKNHEGFSLAQIALANFLASAGPADESKRVFDELRGDLAVGGEKKLPFGDQMALAAVALKNGDANWNWARDEMQTALATADERSVRRLLPNELSQFVQDLRTLKLTEERPEITRLAESLLPEGPASRP